MKNINSSVKAVFAVAFALSMTGPLGAMAAGPAAVNLSSAANFAIISETGITETGGHTTSITGNIGSSPITAAAMTNVFCPQVSGTIYGVDAAYVGNGNVTCFAGNPPLANKTLIDNAVLDMATAYNDAAGRINPTATELYAGNLGGQTMAPGLYKWSTDVIIPTSVTLSGGANDVWIFQIAGNLNVASSGSVPTGVKVILSGGAQASNVFWQVGGGTGATLGTYSTFSGNVLSAKQVILQTGAVLDGRALAQTQVTLDANTISTPIVAVAPAAPASTPAWSAGGQSSGSQTASVGNIGISQSTVTPAPAPTTAAAVIAVVPVAATITTVASAPYFPNAGFEDTAPSAAPWNIVLAAFALILASTALVLIPGKRSA